MKVNTASKELLKDGRWEELNDIFINFRKYNDRVRNRLESLGYKVVDSGKHPKMYIELNNNKYVITLSTTASDGQVGRHILREIRKIYEKEENV